LTLPQREALIRDYANRGIAYLDQALRQGLVDTAKIRNEQALAALRCFPALHKLLQDADARSANKEGPR
jgi:hypothetical protein